MNEPTEAANGAVRNQALTLLETFRGRHLGGTLRRILAWKRLPPFAFGEVIDDVRQELAVDCLQHAATIVALAPRERHLRWMRIAERFVYRTRVMTSRERPVVRDAPSPASTGRDLRDLPWLDVHALGNGRRNLTATARRHGMHTRELRDAIHHLATAAGQDGDYHAFWRTRGAEALIGLAADLLRDGERVLLLPRRRRLPDPTERRQRIRRVLARFPLRPITRDVRAVLQHWARCSRFDAEAPRRLLEDAVALAPRLAAGWLWLFEANCALGDFGRAVQALLAARTADRPPRGAIVLARARLLEARGRPAAALALLRRAHARWRLEPAIAHALARAGG